MKVIGLKETDLSECVKDAQRERIVITRNGKPVALVVGVEGLDAEQLELGTSAEFWNLINRRRLEPTLTRKQIEKKVGQPATRRASKAAQHSVAADAASGASRRGAVPASSKRRSPRRG